MKSLHVKALRETFGFDTLIWSSLLGVSQATVFRWEPVVDLDRVNQIQKKLLCVLRELARDPQAVALVQRRIPRATGSLEKIHALLVIYFWIRGLE